MSETFKLKRTVQCAKCPWKVTTNPHEIPDGYCEIKHKALETTIAKRGISGINNYNYCRKLNNMEKISHVFKDQFIKTDDEAATNAIMRISVLDERIPNIVIAFTRHCHRNGWKYNLFTGEFFKSGYGIGYTKTESEMFSDFLKIYKYE